MSRAALESLYVFATMLSLVKWCQKMICLVPIGPGQKPEVIHDVHHMLAGGYIVKRILAHDPVLFEIDFNSR